MSIEIESQPDNVAFEVRPGETLLAAGLRADITFAHACGGRGKCSTCRVWVDEGLEACPPRNEIEAAMAERLRLDDHVRLACQLRPTAPLSVRRLVLDETDLLLCSQLDREVAGRAGEVMPVTIFFSDIQNFTGLAERLLAYDVMYLLNRYFVQAGDIIERNGGYIDKFIGDGMMAIFGANGGPDTGLRAVNAALQTLAAVDRMKPYFRSMYDADFDVRIGLHHGEAVIGTLGSVGHERLTAIGDTVNIASRVEAANKVAGTRLLITDALLAEIEGQVTISDFLRTRLPGTSELMTLHEVSAITPEGAALLELPAARDTRFFAGRTWTRMLPADELEEGGHRVIPLDELDLVVLRHNGACFAFNNACPHLNIPLFERRPEIEEGSLGTYPGTDIQRPLQSNLTADRGLVCRWHNSCFDLQTGEVRDWAPRLEEGMSPGWEFLGEMSKNRSCLQVFPSQIIDGDLWVALDRRR